MSRRTKVGVTALVAVALDDRRELVDVDATGRRAAVVDDVGHQRHRPFVAGQYGIVSLAPWLTLVDVQPRTAACSVERLDHALDRMDHEPKL